MLSHPFKVAAVVIASLVVLGAGLGLLALRAAGPPATVGKARPPGAQGIRAALVEVFDFPVLDDPKTKLLEILERLAKERRVTFTINERAFNAEKIESPESTWIVERNPIPAMKASLGRVLEKILARVPSPSGAVFLIRDDAIEITTLAAVREELGMAADARFLPLVWEQFEDRELAAALKAVAENTGYNVVVDAKCREAVKKARVTAKLANVPVNTAVRILAEMADLDVVLLDNVFYVTTSDKASSLRDKARRPAKAK
jgi:hypothetical protein